MAGIGFELNKLINKSNFLSKVSGYFYTTSSCLGSMALGFILLFFISTLARKAGIDIETCERFTCYITNTIFLSMLLYSFFSFVLSRYVSDLLYLKKEERILASFWGVLTVIIPLSIVLYLPFLLASKISSNIIVLLLILIVEFVSTWILTLYITILKNYGKITLSFAIAIVLSIILALLCYSLGLLNMENMLLIVIASYAILLICLIIILQRQLDNRSKYTYEFIKWFSKYPSLAFIGIFTTLSALIHFYIMWFSSSGKQIQGFMHNNANYDLAAIMAYCSTLVTTITFIAVLEPNFYRKYKRYFELLNTNGNYQELVTSKNEMANSLKLELKDLVLKQITSTLFFIVVVSQILFNLNIGINENIVETFKILCIGYSLYAIGNVLLQLELYFSDNKGALITSLSLLITIIIGTILSLFLGETFWGIGILLGGIVMVLVAKFRLEKYLNNLEYYILKQKRARKHNKIYILIKRAGKKVKKIMENKKTNRVVYGVSIAVLLVMFLGSFYHNKKIVYHLTETNDILKNPGVGLAPWAKSLSTLELDTALVYIDLPWAEWEPQEGVYDYAAFETKNHIEEYRNQGRQAVFRFYLDYPGDKEHMDIPTWLYHKISKDGTWYDTSYGKGFSPNYENEVLISCHAKAIQALADRYGNDDFFLYIELGSIGHWGEWHVKHEDGIPRLPEYETRMKYITPYIENFSKSTLLMRYPIIETSLIKTGLYNDMAGNKEETEYWLSQMTGDEIWEQTEKKELVKSQDTWKTYPIGGEFSSTYPNSYYLNEHLDTTLLLLKESHQSFIGPKIIIDEQDSNYENMQEVLKILGHRLFVKKCTVNIKENTKVSLSLNITNLGVAPMYTDTELVIYIYNSSGELVSKNIAEDFDARKILPNEKHKAKITIDAKELLKGQDYSICIGFEDKETKTPIIELPMEKYKDKVYKICDISL